MNRPVDTSREPVPPIRSVIPAGSVGLADLAWAWVQGRRDGLDAMAEVLGFERHEVRQLPAQQPESPGPSVQSDVLPDEPQPTTDHAPVPFLRQVSADFVDPAEGTPEAEPDGEPFTDADLDPPMDGEVPTAPPLVEWPRLWRVLDEVLRTPRPRREIDAPALVQRIARGEPLGELPRRSGLSHGRLVLMVDRSLRLSQFYDDQVMLVATLAEIFGPDALRLWPSPDAVLGSHLAHLADDELVVALTDLGFYGDDAAQRPWRHLGRALDKLHRTAVAVVPCPARRWQPATARHWRAIDWEAPVGGSQTVPVDRATAAIDTVLTLLSVVVRVEKGLLREICRLVPMADSGTEAEVTLDPRFDTALRTLDAEERQAFRDRFTALTEEDQRRVAELLQRWHGALSPGILAEEGANLLTCGVPSKVLGDLTHRVEETYGRVGATLDSAITSNIGQGLESWFLRFESRVSAKTWHQPQLQRSLAQAWRAIREHRPDVGLPAGVTPQMLRRPDTTHPLHTFTVWHERDGLRILRAQEMGTGSPVARISAREPVLAVSDGRSPTVEVVLDASGSFIPWFDEESSDGPLALVTDTEQVWLEPVERPPWATSVGRDSYGLWAAFTVDGVEQRLRWISPGRFQMGSPQSEEGRVDREGPVHPVLLTEGFWMAETPCTQALWQAVMGENPSRFQSHRRPVERVSWNDCQRFIDRLNFRIRHLELTLPTEAEWEYACRAGTQTATWLGNLEILGQRNAPLLDTIAWYGGNSGVEYDLNEGLNSSGWSEKQHDHQRAGTREVACKDRNPWGLFDTLGNVLEWCWDSYQSYVLHPLIDSEGPGGLGRVIRGGSWDDLARYVRAAYRIALDPEDRNDLVGFRLARGHQGRGAPDPATSRAVSQRAERGASGSRGSRRATAWVDRLGWAVDGGADEYGRWAAFEVGPVRHRMRWMTPGRFMMGSPESEQGRWNDEGPQHEVILTKGFWLGETPCTQALWQALMGENPSRFRSPNRPVEQVSWEDCQRFLEVLNQVVHGFKGRLPTEAQWEYACRAGTESATWEGDLQILGERNAPVLDKIAWYGGNSGVDFDLADGYDSSDWNEKQYPHVRAGTREVGLKRQNPWGLHDMLGNVWEWCEDRQTSLSGYPGGSRIDPVGIDGPGRVLRGGSWFYHARGVCAAYRLAHDPGHRSGNVGFRLARGPQD